MHILVVGLNHRSAPLQVRERLAFGKDQLADALKRLRHDAGVAEAAILSTCNRVEIYAHAHDLAPATEHVQRFLSRHGGIELGELTPQLYTHAEPFSVQHLFTVASGLDSMVVGEGEILCQVKAAYESARVHGATGKLLNTLFQRAINAAKDVRTQTAIGRSRASVGTVAVQLAEKIFGRLSGRNAVLVGAGAIGEQTLKRLLARGVCDVTVLNRSQERAGELAERCGARAGGLTSLPAALTAADIVVAAASVPGALLTAGMVAGAMRSRHGRPLCLIDLGVPRNVDARVSGIENVYLFNIDDLQGLVDRSLALQQEAVQQSREIIDRKVERFLRWWQLELGCVPSSSAPAAAL